MGTITILNETVKNPITLIGKMAGICYGSNTEDDEKNYKRGLDCIKANHGRAFEFADVVMVIDGYSARVMREYERHVAGQTPYLQSSTRYINYNDFDVVCPPSIKKDKDAWIIYLHTIKTIKNALISLDGCDIPKEDSAMLLPLGMATKIVERRSARSLMEMSRVRECSRAYHEYRQLFNDIKKALSEYSDEWKELVELTFHPKCEEYGYCTEKKSCGRKTSKEC